MMSNAYRDQREQVSETRDHARGEKLVQRLHIRGHARDQPARRIPVEERHRQPLEMLEDLHPQIAHHPLAEEAGKPGLAVRRNEFGHQRQKQQPGAHHHDVHVVRGYRDVDHPPGEERADDLHPALDAQQSKRPVHEGAVRAGIDQQATHQFTIVRLAEYVVFVRLSCGSRHSAVS
jgi:hypothetical protein